LFAKKKKKILRGRCPNAEKGIMREMRPSAAVSGVLQQVPMKMSISPHSEQEATALCPIPCCVHQPHSHRSHGTDGVLAHSPAPEVVALLSGTPAVGRFWGRRWGWMQWGG